MTTKINSDHENLEICKTAVVASELACLNVDVYLRHVFLGRAPFVRMITPFIGLVFQLK